MKKITAFAAAAIMALAISVPVMAEPSDESQGDVSAVSVSESSAAESTVNESSEQENSADGSISENESSENVSDGESTSEGESSESVSQVASTADENSVNENSAEKQKKIYYTDYPIPEAEMYISFPNDMYVLTKDIDINSPALKACKMTRTELIKSFEETGNYIKALASDFTYEVNVNIMKDGNTKKVGDISSLSDSDIQTIADNHLEQPMYTGCSRTKYNNVMYLSFPFEYSEGKTKIFGVQKYTIVKGARIVITFQSYMGEMTESFDNFIVSVMDRVLYDGISPEESETPSEQKKNSEITNLDVRYVYLMLSSLLSLIFLMLIIITAMKYKKSKKKSLPEPVISEPETTEIKEPEKEISETVKETAENKPQEEHEKTEPAEIKEEKKEVSEEKPDEKAEETPKEELKKEETPKEESPKEETSEEETPEKETPKEEILKEETVSAENEDLPVVENQLELVEIAFRIIPALSRENENTDDIWNYIYKKYDDMEFFAAHASRKQSNANAFYRINANSNMITPSGEKENIDEEIRTETLETVVGDSKPEKLEVEAQPEKEETDFNELVGGNAETDKKDDTEKKSENEIYNSEEKTENKNDDDSKTDKK